MYNKLKESVHEKYMRIKKLYDEEEIKKSSIDRIINYIDNCVREMLYSVLDKSNIKEYIENGFDKYYTKEEHFLFCVGMAGIIYSGYIEDNDSTFNNEEVMSIEELTECLNSNKNIKLDNNDKKYIYNICLFTKSYHERNIDGCNKCIIKVQEYDNNYFITNYLDIISIINNKYNYYYKEDSEDMVLLEVWDLIDRLPEEFKDYILQRSDDLYDSINKVKNPEETKLYVFKFIDYPVIPLLLNPYAHYKDIVVREYNNIRDYNAVNKFYEVLYKKITINNALKINKNMISFKKEIKSKMGEEGERIFLYIDSIVKYATRSIPSRENEKYSYFYNGEAIYNASLDREYELSFLSLCYLKGIKRLLGSGAQYNIIKNELEDIEYINNEEVSVEELSILDLIKFYNINSKYLIKKEKINKWNKVSSNINIEWINKIRNHKNMNASNIRNEAIDVIIGICDCLEK